MLSMWCSGTGLIRFGFYGQKLPEVRTITHRWVTSGRVWEWNISFEKSAVLKMWKNQQPQRSTQVCPGSIAPYISSSACSFDGFDEPYLFVSRCASVIVVHEGRNCVWCLPLTLQHWLGKRFSTPASRRADFLCFCGVLKSALLHLTVKRTNLNSMHV